MATALDTARGGGQRQPGGAPGAGVPVKGARPTVADGHRERSPQALLNLSKGQGSRGDLQSRTLCPKGDYLRGDGQRNLTTI